MPFYRYGDPGQDGVAHFNFGRKPGPASCRCARDPKDDPRRGDNCGRMSVALCDAPGRPTYQGPGATATTCSRPVCELHRVKHRSKPNTDFCPEHAALAETGQLELL